MNALQKSYRWFKNFKRFESDKILYKKILTKQKKIFNKINFYRPLSLLEKNIKKNFKEKKILNFFNFKINECVDGNSKTDYVNCIN